MNALNFRFGTYTRTPLTLSSKRVYVDHNGRERINAALAAGCSCVHDGARTASLRRRQIRGSTTVWLQCDACGHSVGNAMSVKMHPHADEYPMWDEGLVEAYDAQVESWRQSLPSSEDRAAQREEAYRQRASDYAQWLRNSPEWSEIKKRILWRSRGYCEACLSANATVVHHLTYEFGKIPPAWHLRAVCDGCHERLHNADDEWCDYGMAREA